jgi:hypothetical protein
MRHFPEKDNSIRKVSGNRKHTSEIRKFPEIENTTQ